MGGLGFVSPYAQFAASVITKNPQDLIEEIFALAAAKGPEGTAKLAELQQLTGVDIRQDIAGSLGSEATFAIDGPMLPVPSWKAIVEVNQPDRLQQAIGKAVTAMNTEAQKNGRGVVLESEDATFRSQGAQAAAKLYTVRFTGTMNPPEIHYTYSDGYLVAAATKDLLRTSVENRSAGVRLDRSGVYRNLLPTDQHANFSALIYQNAQEALKMLSKLAPADQDKVRELAEKVGPTLIGVYADADKIQLTTFGSSMDLLMQTAFAPMFHGGEKRTRVLHKYGTPKQTAAYR